MKLFKNNFIKKKCLNFTGRTKAVGNILKPLPHVPTININRAKPSKIQQARQAAQNINGTLPSAPLSMQATTSANDGVKENLEFLEISTDKRNAVKPRGGKRKRGGPPMTSSQNAENISAGNSSNVM